MEENALNTISTDDGSISPDAGTDDILGYLQIMSYKKTTATTTATTTSGSFSTTTSTGTQQTEAEQLA